MRFIFFAIFALCLSSCIAQRFLRVERQLGNLVELDLNYPTNDYLSVLNFVNLHIHDTCNIDASVNINAVTQVLVEDILGTILGLLGNLLQSIIGHNYHIIMSVTGYATNTITVVASSLPGLNGQPSISIIACPQ